MINTHQGVQELANCPFCGSAAGMNYDGNGDYEAFRVWYVTCDVDNCCGRGPDAKTEAEAIAAWNRRQPAEQGVQEPVAVKDLEWENVDDFGPDASKAACAFGWYFIVPDEDSAFGRLLVSFVSQPEHVCMTDEISVGSFHTFEAAFDAAQSDFRQRVLSCLSRQPDEAGEVERLKTLNADLLMQAQGHAMEARTANSTIYEIYQVLSGATGEPGNWNGAEPAREYVAKAEAQLKAAREALELLIAKSASVLEPLGPGGYLLPSGAIRTNALESAITEARAALTPEVKK